MDKRKVVKKVGEHSGPTAEEILHALGEYFRSLSRRFYYLNVDELQIGGKKPGPLIHYRLNKRETRELQNKAEEIQNGRIRLPSNAIFRDDKGRFLLATDDEGRIQEQIDHPGRIDCWAIGLGQSSRWIKEGELTAYAIEIKVARSDFRADLQNPQKQRWALMYSNLFYFCAPKGLIKPDELPPYAGLLECQNRLIHKTIEAPWRDKDRPSWNFVGSLLKRLL
jgi:hypothetical protein